MRSNVRSNWWPELRRLGLGLALAGGLSGCDLAELPSAPGLIVMGGGANSRVGLPASTGAGGGPTLQASSEGKVPLAEVRALAEFVGPKHAVPPDLILAVVAQESAFKAKAQSWAGAQGLMQLMPGTVAHINAAGQEQVLDPFDPTQNLKGGTWYLSWVRSQVPKVGVKKGEDEVWKLALAGYNGGIGRVQKALLAQQAKRSGELGFEDIASALPAETRNYVPVVMARRNNYRAAP